ncbi:MAG: glycosyltransferase family 4 protein [Chthoniobacterales bacterium]
MRIAFIAPLWAPVPPVQYGGIELILGLLCDGLIALGHDVTLFASGDCQTRAKVHATIPKNLGEMMGDATAYTSEYYTSAVLADALRRQDEFDIFHAHVPLAWMPLASLSRQPCLFTLHTSVHVDDLWALDRYRENPVAAISEAQCAPIRQQIRRELPVIHNGIDFDAYDAAFESGPYLAFLGRMSPEKNPLDAIRMAAAIDLPIVLAGIPQDHKEKRYFEEQVKPLIDGERVRWLGLVDHPRKVELLRNAAALLFPIQWEEPFGLVIIESMACGTPVLAMNRGAVPEIIEPGVTGFTGTTVEELIELLPATMALDRRQVRHCARLRFGCEQMMENYLALYRQLIEEKR